MVQFNKRKESQIMKRKPMDPYFYEVVGKVMHFEGTFHSMFPKVKKAFKGGYKCYPTICFHGVVELDSQLPFRQHVNILVKPDFFNRLLYDNRFLIGDRICFDAKIFYYNSTKVNKRYNYREISIGLKEMSNMYLKEKRENADVYVREAFEKKGGLTTKKAIALARYEDGNLNIDSPDFYSLVSNGYIPESE